MSAGMRGAAVEVQGNETLRRGGDKFSKGKAGHREQGIEMEKRSGAKLRIGFECIEALSNGKAWC